LTESWSPAFRRLGLPPLGGTPTQTPPPLPVCQTRRRKANHFFPLLTGEFRRRFRRSVGVHSWPVEDKHSSTRGAHHMRQNTHRPCPDCEATGPEGPDRRDFLRAATAPAPPLLG